jgi:hypothetical protein
MSEVKLHARASKKAAGYVNAPSDARKWVTDGAGIRCGTCIYFGPKIAGGISNVVNHPGGCGLVQGDLESQACCNLWDPDGTGRPYQFASGKDIEDILERSPGPRNRNLREKVVPAREVPAPCVIL